MLNWCSATYFVYQELTLNFKSLSKISVNQKSKLDEQDDSIQKPL